MRNFQILDSTRMDKDTETLELFHSKESADQPHLALRREGIYVTISVSYGPMEIALRPRYEDLTRTLARLVPVKGLSTTREVGTSQAFLAMGLTQDQQLVLRPTIVADATGHFSMNLQVSSAARQTLFDWLKVTPAPGTGPLK
ncbi:MAG TPA: hypothetical protein VKQ72_11735 [Aggregatilineales bacterium]|nr:hypothetical protein [Aggregatilineales bacterium]